VELGTECEGIVGGSSIRVDHSDTALEAIVEGTLSTASSQNLGLDNGILPACMY
jgi:hypothetical protein